MTHPSRHLLNARCLKKAILTRPAGSKPRLGPLSCCCYIYDAAAHSPTPPSLYERPSLQAPSTRGLLRLEALAAPAQPRALSNWDAQVAPAPCLLRMKRPAAPALSRGAAPLGPPSGAGALLAALGGCRGGACALRGLALAAAAGLRGRLRPGAALCNSACTHRRMV